MNSTDRGVIFNFLYQVLSYSPEKMTRYNEFITSKYGNDKDYIHDFNNSGYNYVPFSKIILFFKNTQNKALVSEILKIEERNEDFRNVFMAELLNAINTVADERMQSFLESDFALMDIIDGFDFIYGNYTHYIKDIMKDENINKDKKYKFIENILSQALINNRNDVVDFLINLSNECKLPSCFYKLTEKESYMREDVLSSVNKKNVNSFLKLIDNNLFDINQETLIYKYNISYYLGGNDLDGNDWDMFYSRGLKIKEEPLGMANTLFGAVESLSIEYIYYLLNDKKLNVDITNYKHETIFDIVRAKNDYDTGEHYTRFIKNRELSDNIFILLEKFKILDSFNVDQQSNLNKKRI